MSLVFGIKSFTSRLEKNSIPFAIIGGLAVFAYGGERTTFDVDFLIHCKYRDTIKNIAEQMGLVVVNENKEVIQFLGQIQIDIVFANRPRAQAMLNRTRKVSQLPYPVVSPEDLIGLKIQAFVGDSSREYRDKADIITIFKSVENLDFNLIKEYADVFGVWNEIEKIREKI